MASEGMYVFMSVSLLMCRLQLQFMLSHTIAVAVVYRQLDDSRSANGQLSDVSLTFCPLLCSAAAVAC